jgi:hypothetical protein
MAVDPQGRTGIRVPKSTSDRPHVYPGTYQLGGAEVAQVVEPALDPQFAC